ncbi:uncharacterized protein LACBIDRAFT_335581 [Laccaria bicolor S238N-H82]|uniref:Predicted protein n=1 Tax=Laccaria bicolor (strain S238N-H82 / ATCC MYA-4686) TaxID=486041 RepID=B0E2Q5_LACBS|nr:uncharacterized protein LACBIDRAFT_335581 [Laccaria bicolor S238N-H82]EDQ98862.1 predicted protein [Laccaria bicolor S238N-H82]|eukprot:XP_001890472.1 predicted protein [Laccaria bicolor S238N-H82]
MSPHKHFINSLNRFERSLFAFDKLAVDSNELAPLLGLDVLKASNAVTLHPTATTASSKGEYKTLASIVSAYRMFEVLALDCEIGVSQPPIRLLPPLSFNKSEQDSEKIVGFDKLENWPKVLLNFRKLIGQSGLPQIPDDLHAGSKHLALLRMASKNKEKVAYVNVVDNFLQAALHLYYLKMTQFRDGSLPDYPDILNDRLHIFKDETSTDEFINDQEEGTYYLQDLRPIIVDFEAVVLRPGDELHMLPNSAHWVYGIDDVIAQGGHYYSSYLMQETLQGIVHAFVLNKFLTNTEHIPSRHLLRRILIFYQVGLIEGAISEDGEIRPSLFIPLTHFHLQILHWFIYLTSRQWRACLTSSVLQS